jgi:hypothetical protein
MACIQQQKHPTTCLMVLSTPRSYKWTRVPWSWTLDVKCLWMRMSSGQPMASILNKSLLHSEFFTVNVRGD